MDGENVQNGAVSEGAVSGDGASTPVATPALTEERVAEIVKASVAASNEDLAKRLKQSFDDRLKASERGRVPTPEFGNVPGMLGDADPETKAKFYEAYFQRQNLQQSQAMQQEQQRAAYEQFAQSWHDTNAEILAEMGIDPTDKRLDWGEGGDYLARLKKLMSSAVRVAKDNRNASATQATKEAAEKAAQAAKDAGLESNVPGGPGGLDDKAFMIAFAEGKRNSKEDFARAQKIQDQP